MESVTTLSGNHLSIHDKTLLVTPSDINATVIKSPLPKIPLEGTLGLVTSLCIPAHLYLENGRIVKGKLLTEMLETVHFSISKVLDNQEKASS